MTSSTTGTLYSLIDCSGLKCFGGDTNEDESSEPSHIPLNDSRPQGKKSFRKIREKCLQSGKLWEDPDFPANDKALFFKSRDQSITWKRPAVRL